MKTVGIIGFGSFGLFVAEKLDPYCKVVGYSRSGKAGKWSAGIERVAASDFIMLCVPLEAYKQTLESIKPHLLPNTVIVDVCSVKLMPLQIIKDILPEQPVLATHPLFGPESAGENLDGHTIVFCDEPTKDNYQKAVEDFCTNLGLKVVKMTAEEHDREMALVHGLTFFIAHGLKNMDLHKQKLATPSFGKLLNLAELERRHSDDLFYTIERGNPFAVDVRRRFIKEIENLEQDISKGDIS